MVDLLVAGSVQSFNGRNRRLMACNDRYQPHVPRRSFHGSEFLTHPAESSGLPIDACAAAGRNMSAAVRMGARRFDDGSAGRRNAVRAAASLARPSRLHPLHTTSLEPSIGSGFAAAGCSSVDRRLILCGCFLRSASSHPGSFDRESTAATYAPTDQLRVKASDRLLRIRL